MLKDFFTFTKNQSRAIAILLIAIFLSLTLYVLMPMIYKVNHENTADELKKMIAQIKLDETSEKHQISTPLTPFPFDPNSLDSLGFVKLGLRSKLIHTLLNYRNKGGRFYNKESVKRIYGMQDTEYVQLAPFIKIENENQFEKYKKDVMIVELNTADTSQLIQLKGIGSKLSMNIVQYRSQLGGFVHVNQLKEVYGISKETFAMIKPSIKVNNAHIQKINLNAATLYEINKHPYLKGEIANAIVEYRKKQHYHIANIQQLKEIELINEEIFRKIAPYITIQ
ncbi:MAG: helix-hairpin-helix domain-containing protein [Bacteroidetes bacterium]|nr:helix-hairpin-helix domain-containing protein [Bacteroidota bacterium]